MRRQTALLLGLFAAGALWAATRGRGVITDAMRALIQRVEGLRLTAYQDTGGAWTIGYGHLILPTEPYYPYGPRRTITQGEADALFAADSAKAQLAVDQLVTVPLSASQRAALVSFVFNVGRTAFATSTLLRKLNAGDYDGAAAEFGKWVYDNGVRVAGLVNRRAIEAGEFAA